MDSITVNSVRITKPNKLLYLNPAISKLEVIEYYGTVSKHFINELSGRPISMVRAPEGAKGHNFYQKHPTESFPEYIERVVIKEKSKDGVYITIDGLNDITYLVNIGVLEFHIWGSKIDDIEHPDRIILDLDPSVTNENVVDDLRELSLSVKELFEANGYKPLIKTSGSKGFHIYADVKEFNYSWDELKVVAKTIAEKIVKQNPKKYTIEFNKKDRGTKIFIDYLRNQRGATMVAPYSLRSKEGACISFPFAWDKLKNITPTFFTIKNYQRYL